MPRSEEIPIRAGDASLAGRLRLPDSAAAGGRAPWALLLASWLPRDRDGAWDRVAHRDWFAPLTDAGASAGLLARLADALALRVVASLRYDKRGCGASGGGWAGAGLFTLIDDARDALAAVRGRPDLDLRRTGIVGHGEGATIAMSVAIADPAIGALTLVGAPARSLRDVLRRGVAERARTGSDREHPIVAALDRAAEELLERAERGEGSMTLAVGAGPVELGLAGWEQAIRTPPRALATMLNRSVTLVHGEHDAWSDPDESRLLRDDAPQDRAWARRLVRGAGHDLGEADAGEIDWIAADLAERLEPRDLPPVLVAIEEAGSG